MKGYGGIEHENYLESYLKELRERGYKTIKTEGISPDAIAVKDNNIFAVECLGVDKIPGSGIYSISKVTEKIERYDMFDNVLFKVFERKKYKKITEEEADEIVNDFITDIIGDR